jgi:ATP-dependent DNA helicase RecG
VPAGADGHQSPDARLADVMRWIGICEEKGSGIDRVVHDAQIYQRPASEFRAGHKRTIVTIFGAKPFDDMDREDRVRACYQLKWLMSERLTNR